MSKNIYGFWAIVSFCVISAACGDTNGNSDSSGILGSDPTQGANRGLTGTIATTFNNQLWKLDLFTGQFSRYDRVKFDQDPAFHNLAKFAVTPIRGEQGGFVMAVDNCHSVDIELFGCIVIMDSEARTVSTLKLNYEIESLPNRVAASHDGQYVTVMYNPVIGSTTLDTYEFPTAKLLREFDTEVNSSAFQFDWSRENSPVLYFSRQDLPVAEISIWSATFNKVTRTISVPFEGYVGEVVSSPDGSQIAFELINSESSVYVVDKKSLNFRRLVQADDTYPNQFFSNPEWSPDGKWILVEHHAETLSGTEIPGLPPFNLIAVPSDAEDLVYHIGDSSPDAVPFSITDNASETLGTTSQSSWWRSDALYWVSQ